MNVCFIEAWIARNLDGGLHLFRNEPQRFEGFGIGVYVDTDKPYFDAYPIDKNAFPQITWENSPKKVKIEVIE